MVRQLTKRGMEEEEEEEEGGVQGRRMGMRRVFGGRHLGDNDSVLGGDMDRVIRLRNSRDGQNLQFSGDTDCDIRLRHGGGGHNLGGDTDSAGISSGGGGNNVGGDMDSVGLTSTSSGGDHKLSGDNSNIECSMCGDVGLPNHLFRCLLCSHRYQHSYCSREYPHNNGMQANICNWCLPSDSLITSGKRRDESRDTYGRVTIAPKHSKITYTSSEQAGDYLQVNGRLLCSETREKAEHGHVNTQLMMQSQVLINGEKQQKSGTQSQAFECLLRVAAAAECPKKNPKSICIVKPNRIKSEEEHIAGRAATISSSLKGNNSNYEEINGAGDCIMHPHCSRNSANNWCIDHSKRAAATYHASTSTSTTTTTPSVKRQRTCKPQGDPSNHGQAQPNRGQATVDEANPGPVSPNRGHARVAVNRGEADGNHGQVAGSRSQTAGNRDSVAADQGEISPSNRGQVSVNRGQVSGNREAKAVLNRGHVASNRGQVALTRGQVELNRGQVSSRQVEANQGQLVSDQQQQQQRIIRINFSKSSSATPSPSLMQHHSPPPQSSATAPPSPTISNITTTATAWPSQTRFHKRSSSSSDLHNMSYPRAIHRRYKLLADVLC